MKFPGFLIVLGWGYFSDEWSGISILLNRNSLCILNIFPTTRDEAKVYVTHLEMERARHNSSCLISEIFI